MNLQFYHSVFPIEASISHGKYFTANVLFEEVLVIEIDTVD